MNKIGYPFVVFHTMTSLDGKIDGVFQKTSEAAAVGKIVNKVRDNYRCQGYLYSREKMLETGDAYEYEALEESENRYDRMDYVADFSSEKYVVAIDFEGRLAYKSGFIEHYGCPRMHVVAVLSKRVGDDYLDFLQRQNVSYIFAGDDVLDADLVLQKLKARFGIGRVLLSGSSEENYSFLRRGLIDEVSFIVAPLVDGHREGRAVFSAGNGVEAVPINFDLIGAETVGDNVLWLRYSFRNMRSNMWNSYESSSL